MLGGLVRLLLFHVLGARVMLGLAVFGWLRRLLGGRRNERQRATGAGGPGGAVSGAGKGSAYQPSQGSSQIVHREPR